MLVLFTAIMVHSCKKDSKQELSPDELVTEKKAKNESQTAAKGDITPNSVPLYCEDLENPCTDPACQPYYDCEPEPIPTPRIYLENFFDGYDLSILNNPDSVVVGNYMVSKNRELINILCTNFPQTYKLNELSETDVFITWAGIIHMLAEGEGRFSSGSMRAINWECVGNVVLGFFDMASLAGDYASLIKNGSSWSSVRGLLWRTAKRYGGWMAAAGVIYEITTECF